MFQETATEYLEYTITRYEEEKTMSRSQNESILRILDLFPPKSFTKTSRTRFLRTTVINEDLMNEIDKNLLLLLLPAVHELTRKMSSPRVIDFQRAKRAISYLAGTADYCLVFHVGDREEIFGWMDSSYNSGEGDRKNRYGHCFQPGKSSRLFVAVCRRSTLIAQFSVLFRSRILLFGRSM